MAKCLPFSFVHGVVEHQLLCIRHSEMLAFSFSFYLHGVVEHHLLCMAVRIACLRCLGIQICCMMQTPHVRVNDLLMVMHDDA